MPCDLSWTKYDPDTDKPEQIPNSRGIYMICARNIGSLPEKMNGLIYAFLEIYPIIYIGIAGRETSKKFGLRDRDYKTHFNGTARKSTLRKSLGVLFGYEKLQYAGDINTTKYRFISEDEKNLSKWMQKNLILYYMISDEPELLELKLINKYAPPLNLKNNSHPHNDNFRKELSKLRCTL